MPRNGILITGGAGYIGSHVVKLLGEKGEHVVTLDNLSTGSTSSVLYGELIVGDISDEQLVTRIIHDYQIDSVIHFAAKTVVPDSVSMPLKYYYDNVVKTSRLVNCCVKN